MRNISAKKTRTKNKSGMEWGKKNETRILMKKKRSENNHRKKANNLRKKTGRSKNNDV